MAPDGRTDGKTDGQKDGRIDMDKPISLRLRRGIKNQRIGIAASLLKLVCDNFDPVTSNSKTGKSM